MDEPPIRQPIATPDDRARQQPPKLESFFRAMTKADASDLHLKAGAPPNVRVRSALHPSKSEPLTGAEILAMADEVMSESQRAFFREYGSIDLAYELEGSDRFRINVFRQRGEPSISVRRVTKRIPSFEELHLPPIVAKVADLHQGLVLLSGPTGSGKSTTIAAMLEHINVTRPCHVVTIEDPIEYIYEDKKALISQREIGIDVADFTMALKSVMRQDPDVILIGEMRDRETFQAALYAAETGHLVLGTVHASGAAQTLGRILDLIPQDERDRSRQSLAFNLQAVICQKLLPSIAKGVEQVPATEVMLVNAPIRQLIEEGRDSEIPEVIASSESQGMHNFTRSLLRLIENDQVDPRVAYENAPNVSELKMRLKGISAEHGGLLGR